METLTAHPVVEPAPSELGPGIAALDSGLEATPTFDVAVIEAVQVPAELSRMQRFRQKTGRIALGEGVGTVLEAGMMAGGAALPLRELVGTSVDLKTYGSEDNETAVAPTRLRKAGRAAGLLAINLATGYAMQKGVPMLMDVVNDNINNGTLEGGMQIAGKIGAMTGASSLLNRRFGG